MGFSWEGVTKRRWQGDSDQPTILCTFRWQLSTVPCRHRSALGQGKESAGRISKCLRPWLGLSPWLCPLEHTYDQLLCTHEEPGESLCVLLVLLVLIFLLAELNLKAALTCLALWIHKSPTTSDSELPCCATWRLLLKIA